MKKEYRIGLFFILVLTIVLTFVVIWRRQVINHSSDENGELKQNTNVQTVPLDNKQNPYQDTDEVSQVQRMEVVTTRDTICIYENIDKKDGYLSIEEKRLPAEYIGLRREELAAALEEDSKVSEDKEKGFQSQHLELFSAERVKILRIYDTTQESTGYYIMEVNGDICVYKHDRTTLYFRTGLRVENLPDVVKREVQVGKYMDNELQVYHFIESYSS